MTIQLRILQESLPYPLESNLKELRLPSMLRNYEKILSQNQGPDEYLLELTMLELEERTTRKQINRIREAKFPIVKTFDNFDFSAIDPEASRQIKGLMSGDYINAGLNVIFIGGSGTGKTHVATSLAYEACKAGKKVRFITICSLANKLIEAGEGSGLERVMEKFARYELLIIDEVGYTPLSKQGAELLFQLFSGRHEKASMIFTTNLPFQEWTQVFGEANLTVALLDRVTHKAPVIKMIGESYRFKESLKKHKTIAKG